MSTSQLPKTTKSLLDEAWDTINANVLALQTLAVDLERLVRELTTFDDELLTINSPNLYAFRNLAIAENSRSPDAEFRFRNMSVAMPLFSKLLMVYVSNRSAYEKQLCKCVTLVNETNELMRKNFSHGLLWFNSKKYGSYVLPNVVYRESTVAAFEPPPLFTVPTMELPKTPEAVQKSNPIPISPGFKPPRFGAKDRESLKPHEFDILDDVSPTLPDATPRNTPPDTDGHLGSFDEVVSPYARN